MSQQRQTDYHAPILLTISRAVTPILLGVISWMVIQLYNDVKELPAKTAAEVETLKLENAKIPLKYLPIEEANKVHSQIRIDLLHQENRIVNTEKAQSSFLQAQNEMQKTLARIEQCMEKIGNNW